MSATDETRSRILDATLTVLARRGARKLAMSDVGTEAGVSRGTLYRYFRNKDELLDAIAGHVEQGLRDAMVKAVERRPALDVRVQAVVESVVRFTSTHPEAIQLVAVEPDFGIEFIRGVFPTFVTTAEELLIPALDTAPTVVSGALTSAELAELVLRIAASTFFVPSVDPDDLPRAIALLTCPHTGAHAG
jgi:AcrR family transcriptional regulator